MRNIQSWRFEFRKIILPSKRCTCKNNYVLLIRNKCKYIDINSDINDVTSAIIILVKWFNKF